MLFRCGWILALGASLLAQTAQPKRAPAAAPAVYPLESVRVQGNRQIKAERILAASGLAIGQPVQKSDFDAARERLVETGAFENVGYEYKPAADGKGYDAVIEVAEVNELFPYRFEDLGGDEAALRAALARREPIYEDRIPATAPVLDRYSREIEKFLGRGVQVTGKLNAEDSRGLAVLFRPATPRAVIAEVRFQGNDAVPTGVLLRSISPVAVGIPYTEAAMRQRLEAAIRPLYEARGRIQVSFPAIATEKAANVDGVVVTVTVNEGPAYNLGAVKFAGIPANDTAAVEKLADFRKGDLPNFDDINAGLGRISKKYRNAGYLNVASRAERIIHEDTHTVDLNVAVQLGPQFRFGKLNINGLDIIAEPAIRKMWGPLEGKAFNPEFPDAFLKRVREEAILENLGRTRAETRIDEASKTVDVTLYFNGPQKDDPQQGSRPKQDQPPPGLPPDIPIW